LGQKLLEGDQNFASAWNFGPESFGNRPVLEILIKFQLRFKGLRWRVSEGPAPHEAQLLHIDSSKSRLQLQWQSILNFQKTIDMTADWYLLWRESRAIISREQLDTYFVLASNENVEWID
jgi:CDP-glucose 4,6-dehydratase